MTTIRSIAVGVLALTGGSPSPVWAQSDSSELVTYTESREPCDDRFPHRKAFFGDLHLHSSYSFDAFAAGTDNDPTAAFAFARGDPLTQRYLGEERTIEITRALDFAGVTDHAEFLGVFDLCTQSGSAGFDTSACRQYRQGLLSSVREDEDLEGARGSSSLYRGVVGEAWQRSQAAADAAYDRSSTCRFTAFNAFEYSPTQPGVMNHRNVIFRNANVPPLPIGFLTDPTPQELWARLDAECVDAEIGCDVLAIPHNPNYSSGVLFDIEYGGETNPRRQARQAQQRARLEPLVEIYQHKGASECSPFFSSDEQCTFERIEQDTCLGSTGRGCETELSFVRGALARGLAEQERIGVNPFRLGIIASTDSHNANPGDAEEDDWEGSLGNVDANLLMSETEFSPGGLVGVWSVENSRDALFEAMRRRETFGTSGPRIEVRLFAGWNYPEGLCHDPQLLDVAYGQGVPMGGTLASPPRGQDSARRGPRFVLQAVNDDSLLQVAQIIKLWVDPVTGDLRETVHDVAGARNNGASVDLPTCEEQGPGEPHFCETWTDPDFNPRQAAVYYARVLENPSCRWVQHECHRAPEPKPPVCFDDDVKKEVQERAWTSPIWYEP